MILKINLNLLHKCIIFYSLISKDLSHAGLFYCCDFNFIVFQFINFCFLTFESKFFFSLLKLHDVLLILMISRYQQRVILI
jgi:hypothetical protein